MDIPQPAFQALLERIEALKASKSIDLSTEEDLSIAVMNLISLEEHFFFTGVKTDKPHYFDLLQEVRALRKDLLGKLIDRHEGETWCITKHLLAATMRLIEVGTKLHSDGRPAEANDPICTASSTVGIKPNSTNHAHSSGLSAFCFQRSVPSTGGSEAFHSSRSTRIDQVSPSSTSLSRARSQNQLADSRSPCTA